jgi:hypothetical protein
VSAFDELQRQLADSVAARSRARGSASIGGIGRWWRSRLGPGALALAASAIVIVVAVATPALSAHHGAAVREEASLSAGYGAGNAEGPCPPCRAVGGRLHGPLSEEEEVAPVRHRARDPREVLVRHGIPAVLWWTTQARRSR